MRDRAVAIANPASVLVSRDAAEPPMPGEERAAGPETSLWIGITLAAPAVLAAVFAPIAVPADPFAAAGAPFMAPSLVHPFGTDDLGRDVLVEVTYGARTSLVAGVSVAALALALGLTVGAIAGFSRTWIDDVLMRMTEFFQVVPRFFLAILVLALFGNTLPNLVLVLALTSWGGLARIVRAEVLSLRERDFVRAARALGAKPARILLRHILPNTVRSLLPIGVLVASSAILTEAGMSYLGLGDPNRVSWATSSTTRKDFSIRLGGCRCSLVLRSS